MNKNLFCFQCEQTDRTGLLQDALTGALIGLAVVKRVVELHSGTVRVESEPAYTKFLVTLPKAQ